MSLERMEQEYQRTHADPVRGWIGLGCVVIGLAIVVLVFVIPGLYFIQAACYLLPQYCK